MSSRLSNLVSFSIILLLLLTSISMFSCDTEEFTPGDGDGQDNCLLDSECTETNQICVKGECVDISQSNCTTTSLCIEDTDCPANNYCNDSCLCADTSQDGDTETDEEIPVDGDSDIEEAADECPSLTAETTLDFGAVNINGSATKTLNIKNICTDELSITSMEIVSSSNEFSFAEEHTFPIKIFGNSQIYKVNINYFPVDVGADEAKLIITSNGTPEQYTVKLISQYKGEVKISASPNPLKFNEILKGDNTAIKSLIITNNEGSTEGNKTLVVTDVYFENNSSNIFTLVTNEKSFNLGQAESKELKIQCIPPEIGEFTSQLIIENNDNDYPQYAIELICEGVYPTLGVKTLENENQLNFGTQPINTQTNITLTISNTGGGELEVQVPTLEENNDGVFSIDTSQFNGSAQKLRENYIIMPVVFSPQSDGEYTAKIKFETSQINSPTFEVIITGKAKPASISASPNPIEFLSQRVGTVDQKKITLTNNSEVQLTITSISIENEAFSFDSGNVLENISLQPEDQHEITVIFSPTSKGNHNSMLHMELSDSVTSEVDVPINAIATAPVISVEERGNSSFVDTVDFKDVSLNTQGEKILDITNAGDATLNITGLEITNNSNDNEFSFENIGGSVQVAAGNTIPIRLHYNPVNWAGPDQGAFAIHSDDPESANKLLNLKGRATDQKSVYSTGKQLDFTEHHYGSVVTEKIEITNGGQIGTLTIADIDLQNTNSVFSFYIQDETLPFELYANNDPSLRNKLTLIVTFSPPVKSRPEPAAEEFINNLLIESNSFLAPNDTIQLKGTGAPCPDGYWDIDSNHQDCEYGECFITNNNIEICDNIDNDCNGETDDGENIADNCTPPEHAYSICNEGQCDFECSEGYHRCNDACVDNSDVNHCGDSCDPCQDPDNGTASCEMSEGVYECSFICGEGYHVCGDECADDTSTLSCGDRCIPCPEPPDGGEASCIAGVCDTECDPGYYQSGTSCVTCDTAKHCGMNCIDCGDDPEYGSFTCQDATCKLYCEDNFHACGKTCYDSTDPKTCGDRCTPCPEPAEGGSAECNNGQCEVNCIGGFYLYNTQCILCNTPTHCGLNCIDCGSMENGNYTCLNSQCFPICNEDFHLCGEQCVSDDNAAHCGSSCQSCEERFGPLPGGNWVCSNETCQIDCESDYHECNGSCLSNNNPASCGSSCQSCEELHGAVANGSYGCPAGQCEIVCDEHYVLENDSCVPDNSIYCCGTNCETCQPGNNSDPVCVNNGSNFECATECKTNYWDLNEDGTDCEYFCEYQSATDLPDESDIDSNCDGIDGVLDHSIFVATVTNGGSDADGNGTREAPFSTIQNAISVASSCSNTPCDVLVSAGQYTQTITLANNISIYGGYDAETWSHNVTIQSTIKGSERIAIIANGLTAPVTVQGFNIIGKDYTTAGQSTYAIWVNNSGDENLNLEYCMIHGGIGGKGIAGSNGSNGSSGTSGSGGSGSSGGAKGTVSCSANGGTGGSSYDCGSSDGYQASAGGDSVSGGGGGSKGTSKCGGCNDEAGDGGAGKNGNNGSNGSGGSSATNNIGYFSNGFWANNNSNAGTRGTNATGGGGGGSGGTDKDPGICLFWSGTRKGGGGGGGGAGGCAGSAGAGGGPGGASFAIAMVNSIIKITNCTIYLGQGGEGGDGGDGGHGGVGKGGGAGYSPDNDEAGRGGAGGTGGNGGGGGGGAGGCGGPAVGIAKVGTSDTTELNVNFESGSGGSGGPGGSGGKIGGTGTTAASGNTGCIGLNVNTYEFAK